MKNKLCSLLLVTAIFTLNAMPVRASDNFNRASKSSAVMLRGRWCFEFAQLGLLCFDF